MTSHPSGVHGSPRSPAGVDANGSYPLVELIRQLHAFRDAIDQHRPL
jgi:hypothetical protein